MRILLALVLTLAAAAAHASTECKQLTASENDVLTIQAEVNKATHIILPEGIVRDFPGNTKLWAYAGDPGKPHYWIKPGFSEAVDAKEKNAGVAQLALEGRSTTVTLVTASRSYDFVVNVVAHLDTPCVRVNEPEQFGRGAIAAAAAPASEASAALPAYTRYSTKSPDVDAIYDDGRFTYVRLKPRPEGAELPALSGGTKKKPELIEANYDALTQTFKVPGIYAHLLLTVGSSAYPVDRL